MINRAEFPVQKVIPELKEALNFRNVCILTAPPGAGKTTIVPPALIDEPWLNGKKIIMLEPRRIAARRAAEYMAETRSEKCGQTIGYRIKNEVTISRKTRIEVVTEGILTRMIQSDMELPEAGLIIFDEFHERSIHADISLAFLLDVQQNIREDLRILIMSATPDLKRISELLNNPPVITAEGKMFPVDTHYLKERNEKPIEVKTTEAIISAIKKDDGDILVFLPGKKEIKRTGALLYEKYHNFQNIVIHELYGDTSRDQQDAALKPDLLNKRKVILSTSLAETSLTIDGIRIVIDCGLSRLPSYNIRRGMPGLMTVPVSRSSADQRRGRAGRQQTGICYRLWAIEEEMKHPDFTTPEILSSDLTQLTLELIKWGSPDGHGLKFTDPPPPAHLNKARSTLKMLGAVDENNKLTSFGLKMSELPVHPRLSAMIIKAKEFGLTYQSCLLAAVLEEREITRSGSNLSEHLKAAAEHKRTIEETHRLFRMTNELKEQIREQNTGMLLAFAYPDRLAKRKSAQQYQLSTGTIAVLPEKSSLTDEEFLIIAELDGSDAVAKIFLAAAINKQDVLQIFKDNIKAEYITTWDNDSVKGTKNLSIGTLSIHQTEFTPSPKEVSDCLADLIRKEGLTILPWSKEAISLRQRSEWYRTSLLTDDTEWPVLSDEKLLSDMSWLFQYLAGIRKKKELEQLKMEQIISSLFSPEQIYFLRTQIPDSIRVPGGSNIRIKYIQGEKPVLAVRLQEIFGQTDTPAICNGKAAMLIHLLSPAMRPIAITQDLKSFWLNTYPTLIKQMRMKYPKHVWPDNPLLAIPTNKTKKLNR